MTDEEGVAICEMCHQPIRNHIYTVGSSRGNPGIKHYHLGCLKRQRRQRFAVASSSRSAAKAGRTAA